MLQCSSVGAAGKEGGEWVLGEHCRDGQTQTGARCHHQHQPLKQQASPGLNTVLVM